MQGDSRTGDHWLLQAGKVVTYSVLAIVLMFVINTVFKVGWTPTSSALSYSVTTPSSALLYSVSTPLISALI